MKVSKALAALRGDNASQRRTLFDGASAMRRARQRVGESVDMQALRGELERYAGGVQLASCPKLAELMGSPDKARQFWKALATPILSVLKEHCFGEAPFAFRVSRGHSQIQVFKAGRATLNLATYEPLDTVSTPKSALLTDRETVEIVVSGRARGFVHQRGDSGVLTTRPAVWDRGGVICTEPLQSARQIVSVERTFLLLQLTRDAARARPTCEMAIETGKVLRTASGDKSASQAVMALGVLGALRSHGAIDVMHQTALNRSEDAQVRWEAVRQILGLDPKRGLEALGALIDRPDDPLSKPAKALRTQLFTTQPELRVLLQEAA